MCYLRLPVSLACLFLFSCPLVSQSEIIYHRGWQINLSLGLEGERLRQIVPYLSAADTAKFFEGDYYERASLQLMEGDEINTFYQSTEVAFRARPGKYTPRYNLQLRFHRKFINGLEYSLGTFFSSGNFNNVRPSPPDGFIDYAFATYQEHYRRIGLSGSLGVVFLRHRRVQPFLNAQAIINHYHSRLEPTEYFFTRINQPIQNPEAKEQVFRIYELNFRLLTGLMYSLNENYAIGFETKLFPDFDRFYTALNFRYRLTRY